MRIIVAGGRFFHPTPSEIVAFRDLWAEVCDGGAAELVHGAHWTGVDEWVHGWGLRSGLRVTPFPADWKARGRSAGPYRNRQMARYAAEEPGSSLIWFPGGSGTLDMRRQAAAAGLSLHPVPVDPLGDLCRRIVAVLSTPSDDCDQEAKAARRQIGERYGELKRHWSFQGSSILARLEWLEGYLREAAASLPAEGEEKQP